MTQHQLNCAAVMRRAHELYQARNCKGELMNAHRGFGGCLRAAWAELLMGVWESRLAVKRAGEQAQGSALDKAVAAVEELGRQNAARREQRNAYRQRLLMNAEMI